MNKHLILAVISSLCAVTVARCPFYDEENWKEFRNTCYYFSDFTHAWDAAKYMCLEHRNGSHLVDILSEEENRWIHERLNGYQYPDNYYIGATDREVEGVFHWNNTGETLSYTNWARGEPNNRYLQDCVQIRSLTGEWDDFRCDRFKRFICKRASVRN